MARESGASRALLVSSCARFTDVEQGLRVARGFLRHFLRGPPEGARHGAEDMRQERGLVAPRLGLRPQVTWREIGRVRLEQQAVARNLAHQLQEMLAAPLVADPAGDADVEVEVEVRAQLLALAG